jgi:hypothetical protein
MLLKLTDFHLFVAAQQSSALLLQQLVVLALLPIFKDGVEGSSEDIDVHSPTQLFKIIIINNNRFNMLFFIKVKQRELRENFEGEGEALVFGYLDDGKSMCAQCIGI